MRRNAVAAAVIVAVAAWAAPTAHAQYFDVGKLPAPPVFGPEIAANVKSFSETYRGRVTGTVQEKMAATFLRDEAAKLGYDSQIVTFSAGANDPGGALQAVVATKRGLTKPDEHILFVGHYDTIASTVDGAYDNGSGTTMMRALSKSIAGLPTNRTVVFVWYNAEEEGLLASQRHAAQWKAQNKATRAVLGFDMTGIAYPVAAPDPNSCLCMWHGQDDEGFIDLLRYVNFQVLGFPDAPTLVEIPGVNARNSDEREFDRQGYPVLRWAGRRTAASYSAYHRPDDTMATMEAVAGGRQFVEEGLRNTLLSSYYTFLALDNQMPVASAVATGDRTVTFSAAASHDPDGPPSAFRWSFGDGATGTGRTVTHSYDQAGEYLARLIVEDNIWPQVTASATVHVRVFGR